MRTLSCFFIISILSITTSFPLLAQEKLLGEIDFPNSGSELAQTDFIEGVLFLHNFEYEDAARAFRRAREADSDFVLAFWGEAMTHNHPIWMEQYRSEAMSILQELGPTVEDRQAKASTQREKDYLMAIEVLYGNSPESQGKTKNERDLLYRDAMKNLHQTYPDDHEATTFYGLSILGTAHEGRDYAIYMRAAAEIMEVWSQNHKHPGAAHYLIHSFDDPIHAPLGLPMAKVYSEIAPAAAHAQHMTSHIFLALGMWDDVIDANIVARDVQTTRQEELQESTTVCGHYPWWLQYGYLQEGNIEEAQNVLNNCSQRLSDEPSEGELWHFAIMRAHQVVDSENWEDSKMYVYDYKVDTPGARNYYFSMGYDLLQSGNIDEAKEYLELLKQTENNPEKEIQVQQLAGMISVANGNIDDGLSMIRSAVAAESELPIDFGPPTIVKPSLELLGDQLNTLGNHAEALQAYEKQLDRTPNRRKTVLGKEQGITVTSNQSPTD